MGGLAVVLENSEFLTYSFVLAMTTLSSFFGYACAFEMASLDVVTVKFCVVFQAMVHCLSDQWSI